MLKTLEMPLARASAAGEMAVEILSIATANPGIRVPQGEALERAKMVFPQYARLEGLFANTGIEGRYSCQPTDWYHEPHGWEERTEVFQRHALALLEEVAVKAATAAGLELCEIGAIVTNTITGLAIPSLDAMLMNRLPFAPDAERLPIFGLGCGGGVAGMSRAARIAHGSPGTNVLFMTIDLCSLCLRPNDPSMAMFVSAALFGDGAAGVVLRSTGDGSPVPGSGCPVVRASGEHWWKGTEHIMGWDIKEDGFGVVLSPELPTLMRENLGPALAKFLSRNGLSLEDFKGFLFHPGGRKVLDTVEEVLPVSRGKLEHSWGVLRDYGNMSSATALFVLDRAITSGAKGRHLLVAFGPGFSAYFAVVDL